MAESGQSMRWSLLAIAALLGQAAVTEAVPPDWIFGDDFESGALCAWTTGSVAVSWTVDGGSPAAYCPPDSAVWLLSVSGPHRFESTTECLAEMLTVDCLLPGPYTLGSVLEDPVHTYGGGDIVVTILAGQIAILPSIDFVTTTGTASITWTLINSQINPGSDTPAACPPAGNMAVTFTGPTVGSASGPCSSVPLVIDDLARGPHTFDLLLTDEINHPGQSAAAQVMADIIAENTADIQVTIDCTFCPALPNLGTASITWTLINSQINPGFDTPAVCPPNGNVAVAFGGPTSGGANGPCSSVPLAIPNLVAGAYTFDLLLTDEANHPGQSSAAQVMADIVAGNTADIQVTIDCTFCYVE